ncbi:putative lipoprotein [Streptomyces ipomoeae 91-03]|uniref:Putative lipoprotein n=1 Tax=Streptomyces ipomoeae 91-03 TaxID=698759 RepID=L1KN15_9ACTN|nr:putative lipoprotein [Streptomyces ipomoeae 91-03]
MGRAVARLARFTGPLLIVLISASCGFVIGVAVSIAPATP